MTARFLPALRILPLLAAALMLLNACSKKEEAPPSGDGSASGPESSSREEKPKSEDFVKVDAEDGPDAKKYAEAARPFAVALASGDYAAAHNLLSSHAKARMTLAQFKEPATDEEFASFSQTVHENVTPEKFAELMQEVETLHGKPAKPLNLHVQTTDPGTLSGKVGGDTTPIDILFAIGNMPADIPADIRKASLRGRTGTTLSEEELAKIAQQYGTTPEDLKKDPDFQPYYNYKIVLVEEDGQLKVGHFEFMRPNLFD